VLFIHSLTLQLQHKIPLPTGQQERCTAAKHYSNTVQYCECWTVILGSLGRKAGSTPHVLQNITVTQYSIVCVGPSFWGI
jgi:hypothetical protein